MSKNCTRELERIIFERLKLMGFLYWKEKGGIIIFHFYIGSVKVFIMTSGICMKGGVLKNNWGIL